MTSYKRESFRPEFDPEVVTRITNNKSKFYNIAIKEKIYSIDIENPTRLKELNRLYEIKEESYNFTEDEINRLKKRIQVLENKNKMLESELNDLKSEIDKLSKEVKHKEEIKQNQNDLIEENRDKINNFCKKTIKQFYIKGIDDNKEYAIPDFVKKLWFNDELSEVFKDWNSYCDYFRNYIKSEVDENYMIDFNNTFEDRLGIERYNELLKYVDQYPDLIYPKSF